MSNYKISYKEYANRYNPRIEREKNCEAVLFNTIRDAANTLAFMEDIIKNYDVVTVADFKDLTDKFSSYNDVKYGWINLENAKITKTKHGYCLELPKPLPICDCTKAKKDSYIEKAYDILITCRETDKNASIEEAIGYLGQALDD